MDSDPPRAIPRREFVRSAVAIGGASALSACLEREADAPEYTEQSFPQGPDDPSVLPDRQHAWNAFIPTGPTGDTRLPEQQLLLLYEYTGPVPPTESVREDVEATFQSIERAYQRGRGTQAGASFVEGLLFTVGYSPRYFDRFDESLPEDIDLQRPETVIDRLEEDAEPETADLAILLNSDRGSVVLGAEAALAGEIDRVNGVDVEGGFHDVFEQVDRRPAVVGRGNPHEELDHEAVEEHAPLSMGFKSGFDDSNPAEDRVTFDDGPFAGGTTQLVSRLGIDLDSWYELDDDRRVKQMFSTGHDRSQVGPTGERMGAASGIGTDDPEDLESKAEEHGCLGHSEKTARARDDDFQPKILRRSEGNTSDPEHGAAMNFTSLQSGIEDFVETREAMDDLGGDIEAHQSGIVDFLTTERRGTFLVPPRSLRTLPSPRPDREN